MKDSWRRTPDLEFNRDYGRVSDGIEFYVDDDHLEIKTVNADSDTFQIILTPDEVKQLRHFLNDKD